ncbi:MAG: hypothetical protein HY843_02495 [Bdellovibrio sp.]|nr:hypothetical protein [Bdellovibrio sp.]
MPRKKTTVKVISQPFRTQLNAIDLHFHGAFGIDLMHSNKKQLNKLSKLLWKNGIKAFCPTTISASKKDLSQAVSCLGEWISKGDFPGAIPLGIHLEGPFISSHACGAHPKRAIRHFSLRELSTLWEKSLKTLKIITLAPELLSDRELKGLCHWSRQKKVILSIGHSQTNFEQAKRAFHLGFSGVTHAWNAMSFHHRDPGILGAAIGNPEIYIELIIDQTHVSPHIINWMTKLHKNRLCFVSDCVPAAKTRAGTWHAFGNLRIQAQKQACVLKNGKLAGSAFLLTDAFQKWFYNEIKHFKGNKKQLKKLFYTSVKYIYDNPLNVISQKLPKN